MSTTIHFPEKVKQDFVEKFSKESETDDLFTHDLDTEFSGVKTVHVKTVKSEPLQDYNRSKEVGTGSRYGTTKEVGDHEVTYTMTQDKALSLSIDKGNNKENFNMIQAARVMKAERQERIVPTVDKYRLDKWAKEAGIHVELAAAPTKSTILQMIMDAKSAMVDAGCPETGIQLRVARKFETTLKLSDEWVKLNDLGGKTLPKGTMGELDGMPTKFMTTGRMPENVPFMLIHKGSCISPMKINDYKGHVDPPGLSGDLLEFRLMYDAFVLAHKSAGVLCGCLPGTVVKTPTISMASNKATLACETSGAAIYYTTDGSDPRYSVDKKLYSTAVTLAAGDELRVCAEKAGMFWSDVAAQDYAG